MSRQWYVLKVKPHKERAVYRQLFANEVEVYFPALRVEPKNPRASRVRPYFPGYLFVQVDLTEEGLNAFRWTPGTDGLVRFGNEPAAVPENLIHELKKRLAALEEAGASREYRIEKGSRVRILTGPFAGYEAIFDAHLSAESRVQVLLAFLSQHPQRLQMDAEDIEEIED